MAKTIKSAKLHQGIFVLGIGTMGDTLPPSGRTLYDFQMIKVSDGIDCQGTATPGAPLVRWWVPSANVASAVYGPELAEEYKNKA